MARKPPQTPAFPSPPSRCFNFGDVDLVHFHHRGEGALGFGAAGGQCVHQYARGDLPGDAPPVLAPAAVAWLAAVADDRIPVTIRFLLRVRRDLEGEGFGMFELRPAIESQAGDAANGEFHGEDLAFPAVRVVARGLVNPGDFTVRERGRVKARRVLRVLVEPDADGVLRFHGAHQIPLPRTFARILFATSRNRSAM